MKNYDLELSVVLDDHGFRQALGLQAKTGTNQSKIVKFYAGGRTLINSDGSVSADKFTPDKRIRINFIGHGEKSSSTVSDTAQIRTWEPAKLAADLKDVADWALPAYKGYKFKRLSMIVCYGGGHTYTTKNEYGHHIHPNKSFGYKFFEAAKGWLVDMTARGDISITIMERQAGVVADSLNYTDYTGASKVVGVDEASHDKYRKVRFYQNNGAVEVEWPYLGYDN